ncbi:MAG: hypothetical protein AB8F78_00005 [Saprospiraceae bacterium]
MEITTFVDDSQSDNYTYTTIQSVFTGFPNTNITGSYIYSSGYILHSYSEILDGHTSPSETGTWAINLNVDGNISAISNTKQINGGPETEYKSWTYRYLPGTELPTEILYFEGETPILVNSSYSFYSQDASSTKEALPTFECKLQTGNTGPMSFQAASALFTGTYKLLDRQGRILQITKGQSGQSLELNVPTAPGLY